MHCINADLPGQAITLAGPVEQASVARDHRSPQLPAARKEHLVSLLREARHAAVTALPAFIQHRPAHHVPRPHSTTSY